MRVEVGPPRSPLPLRWWFGLSRRQVRRVVSCELRGCPRVMPARHEKGYVRLYLGRGHPYADTGGTQHLHRWLMQRHLGERLTPDAHVHHRNGNKETADVLQLEVMIDFLHGHYHWHWHGTCRTCPGAHEELVYSPANGVDLL